MKYILYLFLVFILFKCASIKAPQGGPIDNKGPELVYLKPGNERTNFYPKKIKIKFNEHIQPTGLDANVFVSPSIFPAPKYLVNGKRITIKIPSTLESDITYVIAFGSAIQDFTEKNPMKTPLIYAFSTGDELDTCSFIGNVTDVYSKKPEKDMIFLLYEPDSVKNNQFLNVKPKYLTRQDSSGTYQFKYIKYGTYKILGIVDKDKSLTLSEGDTKVALPDSNLFTINKNKGLIITDLTSFNYDPSPPIVKKITQKQYNLTVEMDETLVNMDLDSTSKNLFDSYSFKDKSIKLLMKSIPNDTMLIYFKNLTDTLGNTRDTIVKFLPSLKDTSLKLTFTEIKTNNPWTKKLEFNDVIDFKDNNFSIIDTSNNKLKFKYSIDKQYLNLEFAQNMDTTKQYKFIIDTLYSSKHGFHSDSLTFLKFKIQSPEIYGSISGRFISKRKNNLLILMNLQNNEIFTSQDSVFRFDNLPSAMYQITLLEDLDNNKRWTSSKLSPFVKAEDFYIFPENIKVRSGTEVSDVIVKWD